MNILRWLRVIWNPSVWIVIYPYHKYCDEFVRGAIRRGEFEAIDEYQSKIGGKLFWTANAPYGYRDMTLNTRTSRATALELRDFMYKNHYESAS